MNNRHDQIKKLVDEIEGLIACAVKMEQSYAPLLDKVHPLWKASAKNLVHYRAMCSYDLRELQKQLGNIGLSRLAKAEAHVMASLHANVSILKSILGKNDPAPSHVFPGIKESNKLLRKHAKSLFGHRTPGRQVRIMVTQPSDSAENPEIVETMMQKGMNTLRINCAHDGPAEWNAMIEHARQSMRKTGLDCHISMDLGGPKIRTGAVAPGPKVIHLRPPRNRFGHIIATVPVLLVPHGYVNTSNDTRCLPLDPEFLNNLESGDLLRLTDTRGKKRSLTVVNIEQGLVHAQAKDSIYIATGTRLYAEEKKINATVGELPVLEEFILLKSGDELVIHRKNEPGEPAEYAEDGTLLKPAHISCTSAEVFASVKIGEVVLFDDGKIAGIIKECNTQQFTVEITYAREKGSKLKADKGINFPASQLNISGLTQKDRDDLKFVAAHADVVNMSFVNKKEDVEDLIREIRALGAEEDLGIILKIETRAGFQHLVEILLTAMQIYPLGVMIARGDLAIECGWENIGRIQEEILWLCQAAHVPTVWATQVFENLAKKGIPSRAEITNAVMSQRADCVMLNKGPYIINAVSMLDQILKSMQNYQEKKAPMLPPLQMQFT